MKNNFQGTSFSAHFSYFSGNLEEEKPLEFIALEFIFLVSQKFLIYKIPNTLKLFWLTIDSSVLLNEGDQLFFHVICLFSFMAFLNISAHLSMQTILMDPNLVRTFFSNNVIDPNYGAHLWKWLFYGAHKIRIFTVMAVLTTKSVTQLTAFIAFETGRKLNSVCCILLLVPLQTYIWQK